TFPDGKRIAKNPPVKIIFALGRAFEIGIT
ncbi:unnamed protein product, partial [marine sediment metagenome]